MPRLLPCGEYKQDTTEHQQGDECQKRILIKSSMKNGFMSDVSACVPDLGLG